VLGERGGYGTDWYIIMDKVSAMMALKTVSLKIHCPRFLFTALLAMLLMDEKAVAQQPVNCSKSTDGTKFCYDKDLRTYSVYRKDGGYVYGKCGGTVRWGGSFEFIGASQFHSIFCDGEEINPR